MFLCYKLDMESTIKNRLQTYIKHKGLSDRKFGIICGLSGGFVSSIKNQIRPDSLKAICFHFPDLNRVWLLTGEGNMTNDSAIKSIQGKKDGIYIEKEVWNVIKCQAESLSKRDRQIDDLIDIIKKTVALPVNNVTCAAAGSAG